MNSISLVSTIAMSVGLAAALPQILQMLRTRSSSGQSVLGWGMGLVTNASMAYVNLIGFHSTPLAASNLLSASLCVAAMGLIVQFRGPELAERELDELPAPVAIIPLHRMTDAHHHALHELPTRELVALTDTVLAARDVRQQRAESRGEAVAQLAA
jgi:hypothetical protein